VGRIVLRPAELPAGIVTAVLGAPVLILLVRRQRASGL
jgi:iron complex transport system permease protein